MAEYTVGQASIAIVPTLSGIAEKLDAAFAQYGDSAGSKFSDAFNARVDAETSDAIGPQDADAAAKGDSAGGLFADAFKARIDAALKSLPDAKIDGDSSDADRKIADVRLQLEDLRNQTVGIDISDSDALAKLAVLKGALEDIGHTSESPSVKVNTGAAVAEIGAGPVVGDLGGAGGGVEQLGTDAESSGGSIAGVLIPALALLATALIPIGGLAAGALSAIPAILAGAGSGVAAIALALPALELAFKATFDPLEAQLKPLVDAAIGPGFVAGLSALAGVFQDLEPFIITAASGIGLFVDALGHTLDSQPSLKNLNAIFSAGAGFMEKLAGDALSLVPAFLTIGAQAAPVVKALGDGISSIVSDFAKWVSNGGFEKFLTWLKTNGPGIAASLETLAKNFGKVIIALLPVGETVLKIIGVVEQFAAVFASLIPLFTKIFDLDLPQVIDFFRAHWEQVWNDIHNIVNTIWHAVDNDVFQPLENFFTQTIPHAMSVFSGVITSGFQSVHDIINTIWHAVDNDVLQPFELYFTRDLPQAFDGLGGQLESALSDVAGIIEAPFIAAWHVIDGIYNDIKSALNFITGGSGTADAPGSGSGGSVPGQPSAGRASGGPVLPGLSYVVGEQGREILSMGATGGFVTNAGMSAPILSGLSGGSNAPLQYVENQNIASPSDALSMSHQLAGLARGLKL